MARVYRITDSLTQILNELRKENITSIKSLDEILILRDNKPDSIFCELNEVAKEIVALKIENLKKEISDSSKQYAHDSAEVRYMQRGKVDNPLKKFSNAYKIHQLERSQQKLSRSITDARKELSYLKENTELVIEETFGSLAKEIQTIRSAVEENSLLIASAVDEDKAVNTLSKLPDSYHIINDFKHEFPKEKDKRKEADWIESLQTDHIVIGPPGVFAIETRNWINESARYPDLSFFEQIRRNRFALSILLNNAISASSIKPVSNSFKHDWGTQEIAVRGILLMVYSKMEEEYKSFKICSLHDLNLYIDSFAPILNEDQTQALTNFLLDICE